MLRGSEARSLAQASLKDGDWSGCVTGLDPYSDQRDSHHFLPLHSAGYSWCTSTSCHQSTGR